MFAVPMDVLASALNDALRRVGAQNVDWSLDHRTVSARVGLNIWSWGERLSCAIDPSGQVHVQSACVLWTQIFDWGKNAKNCRRLLEAIGECLAQGTDPGRR